MAYDSEINAFRLPVTAPYTAWSNYMVLELYTREDASNVHVTAQLRTAADWGNSWYGQYNDGVFDWTMELQRAIPDVRWDTIGSREGYVTLASDSNRTFTNVGGGVLRVQMKLTNRLTGKITTVTSSSFERY